MHIFCSVFSAEMVFVDSVFMVRAWNVCGMYMAHNMYAMYVYYICSMHVAVCGTSAIRVQHVRSMYLVCISHDIVFGRYKVQT